MKDDNKSKISKKLLLAGIILGSSAGLNGCVPATAGGGYSGYNSYQTQRTPIQDHYSHEREQLFRHQQNELRRYGSSEGLWNHQQRERHRLDRHQGHY
jgi:hypothetical protein